MMNSVCYVPARIGRGALAIAVIGLLLLASGCAGLPTQSFVSSTAEQPRYDGFMAYAAFSDLGVEGAFESALCDRLHDTRHACETMLDAAPPTRSQNAASRHRAALASGAQAVILIELADPAATSRRILAGGRPGYRISVVDTASQEVIARLAIEGKNARRRSATARAKTLAKAIVAALRENKLLKSRG
ncbi:hypothetical protein V5738_14395 [Salinisphaera sp. SPP-AMP-43]|uniref:hypothetical protein n=1 Tax=Salinisphaera sp. SPP-AMP-43 TaxID=3121288 RepID=UPI003C6E953E